MSSAHVLACLTQSLHVGHHYVWSLVGILHSGVFLLVSDDVNPCPIQCPGWVPTVAEGPV